MVTDMDGFWVRVLLHEQRQFNDYARFFEKCGFFNMCSVNGGSSEVASGQAVQFCRSTGRPIPEAVSRMIESSVNSMNTMMRILISAVQDQIGTIFVFEDQRSLTTAECSSSDFAHKLYVISAADGSKFYRYGGIVSVTPRPQAVLVSPLAEHRYREECISYLRFIRELYQADQQINLLRLQQLVQSLE